MREARDIKTVAVLGCGFVGFSWGVVFARHGCTVHLYNRPSPSLASVKGRIADALEFLRSEGVIDAATVAASLSRVHTFDELPAAIKRADYVQEALPEDLDLKQRVFAEVAGLTGPDVVIASSCSGLMRADIVRLVNHHPGRCLVAHPANPPHLIPFVEVAGDDADEAAKQTAVDFMAAVGQRPVRCREVYGYVLNRLQLGLIQQALHLVREQICDVAAVEEALTEGLGLRWAFQGPYGVEELNSADLEEGLRKYRKYMLEGFRALGTVEDYDDEFVRQAVAAFSPMMQGRDHEQYRVWRDRMILRTRLMRGGQEV